MINGQKYLRDYQVEFGAIHDVEDSDIMLIIQDITKQREYEDQLKAARKEAQDASKLKGQFLANMSHEIRTPLNGIIGMIDLTRHMVKDEELIDNLKTAKTSSEGLLRIINDVLDYSKLEAGKMKFRQRAFKINEFAEELVRENGFEAKLKGLSMNLVIDPMVNGWIISDKLRLKQVLTNLIGNSIKFTESGGVTLKIIGNHFEEDSIELTMIVADTGIGVDENQKEMLFESFTQADGSYTRETGGTGLGLAISKEIVEKLGGTIIFESVMGKGTEFSVTITFRRGTDWSTEEARSLQASEALSSGHVLIVEDDKINQMVLKKKLEMSGSQVDVAENGKAGLKMFDEGEYDLVIMDIQMPVMSGTDAIDLLRKTDKGKKTPIIALTALALREDRATIMNHGFDMYITKPVDLDEMATIAARMIMAKSTYEYANVTKEVSNQETNSKKQRDLTEVNHYLSRIKRNLIDGHQGALESNCLAIKEYFETQHMTEYRMLAFRMAMEARKEKYVHVERYFNDIVAKLETVV